MIAHETKLASALMAYFHDALSIGIVTSKSGSHRITSEISQAMKMTDEKAAQDHCLPEVGGLHHRYEHRAA